LGNGIKPKAVAYNKAHMQKHQLRALDLGKISMVDGLSVLRGTSRPTWLSAFSESMIQKWIQIISCFGSSRQLLLYGYGYTEVDKQF
jgi:hypothetical protein